MDETADTLPTLVDFYCERTGPGFWNEPLNAISNVAFIAAALALFWLTLGRREKTDWPLAFLVFIIVLVGIGSFLFHTFATVWALWADVIPIAIFIHTALVLGALRRFGLQWWGALIALGVFVAAGFFVPAIPLIADLFAYGSAGYVPALLAILVFAIVLAMRHDPYWAWFGAAFLVFAVSLTARTADIPLCTAWPVGTHFIWHLLNGVTLFLIAIGLRQERTRVSALSTQT